MWIDGDNDSFDTCEWEQNFASMTDPTLRDMSPQWQIILAPILFDYRSKEITENLWGHAWLEVLTHGWQSIEGSDEFKVVSLQLRDPSLQMFANTHQKSMRRCFIVKPMRRCFIVSGFTSCFLASCYLKSKVTSSRHVHVQLHTSGSSTGEPLGHQVAQVTLVEQGHKWEKN